MIEVKKTDKDKLKEVFDFLLREYKESEKTLTACGRKFYFDSNGKGGILKILDYEEKRRYVFDENGEIKEIGLIKYKE